MDTPPVATAPSLPPLPLPDQGSDKLLAILCHASLFLGVGFILPLIVFLVKRADSPFVAAHAKEVLNFHISLLIYFICAIPLIFILIGIPIFMGLGLMASICAIIAVVRASEGRLYFYPMTLRLIT